MRRAEKKKEEKEGKTGEERRKKGFPKHENRMNGRWQQEQATNPSHRRMSCRTVDCSVLSFFPSSCKAFFGILNEGMGCEEIGSPIILPNCSSEKSGVLWNDGHPRRRRPRPTHEVGTPSITIGEGEEEREEVRGEEEPCVAKGESSEEDAAESNAEEEESIGLTGETVSSSRWS